MASGVHVQLEKRQMMGLPCTKYLAMPHAIHPMPFINAPIEIVLLPESVDNSIELP